MDMEGSGGAVDTLAERIRHAAGPYGVPSHVVRRIAYTLAGQAAVFVDVDLTETASLLTGRVAVFTERHLAVATVNGLTDRREDDAGDVHLTVLPRHSLTAIQVAPLGNPLRNNVMAWRPDRTGFEDAGWPSRAAVSLTYPALDTAVVLPSRRSTENFDAFLPSLLDDLAGA